MAQLYRALAISGATDSNGNPLSTGRAWFFIPGTATSQKTVFADADGLYPLTQPVALDAGGHATVYTNGVVRVQLEDVNGVLIDVFDRGNTVEASEVEVENAGYTGTILSGGAAGSTGAGGRTDLDTVLSRLYASTGGVDGQYQVLSTSGARIGTARSLTTAISDISVNVKSFLCGDGLPVAGDGVHVDTTGIQQAINYVNGIGGGILYFPPGTYLIDQALIMSSCTGVTIVGAGMAVCSIKGTNGIQNCFTITSGNQLWFEKINLTHSATSTGTAFSVAGANNFTLKNVGVNGIAMTAIYTNAAIAMSGLIANIRIIDCDIAGKVNLNGSGLSQYMWITGGRIWAGTMTFDGTTSQVSMSGVNIQNSITWAATLTGTIFNLTGNALNNAQTISTANDPIIYLAGNSGWSADAQSAAIGGNITPKVYPGVSRCLAASGGAGTITINAPAPASFSTNNYTWITEFISASGGNATFALPAIMHKTSDPIVTNGHTTTVMWLYDFNGICWREITRTDTVT